MLLHDLKIAWRNLLKDKQYSLINALGIGLSSAVFVLICSFVLFEHSYEDFHPHSKNIFRLSLKLYDNGNPVGTDVETHTPTGPALKERFPQVVDYVRIQDFSEIPELNNGKAYFRMQKVYAADPSIFSILNFRFLSGDPKTALNDPSNIVLSEKEALRFFGTTDVLGKTLRNDEMVYTVSAVFENLPVNTHLKISTLVPFQLMKQLGYDADNWAGNNTYTYLLMKPGTDLDEFNKNLRVFSKERMYSEELVAEPMQAIHLYSHKSYEPEVNGDITTVRFLLAIGIVTLLIGAINYINLSTSKALERQRETGLRKILGSSRGHLIRQFMIENVLINTIAIGFALLLIAFTYSYFADLVGMSASNPIFQSATFWIILTGLFLLNCIFSGTYPAMVLSAVKPASVVHRVFTGTVAQITLRKLLVSVQFIAAVFVLSISFIIYQQQLFLRTQNLGVDAQQTLVLHLPVISKADSVLVKRSQAFKTNLASVTGVESVTLTQGLPGVNLNILNTSTGMRRYGQNEPTGFTFVHYGVDVDFIPAIGARLAAGRNFHGGFARSDEFVINNTAAKLLGYKSPEEAVGQRVSWGGPDDFATVIGVIEDYHQESLKEAVSPIILYLSDKPGFAGIRVSNTNISQTVAEIEKMWQNAYPGYPLEYQFMDKLFNEQYQSDKRFEQIVRVFSLLTLIVTCLGLLGLTTYALSKREKEISIRKVLGASVSNILMLISKDTLYLFLIAIVIACPVAWLAANAWLTNFAYRIALKWWMFALPGVAALIFAFLTISLQSLRASLANPVDSIRKE